MYNGNVRRENNNWEHKNNENNERNGGEATEMLRDDRKESGDKKHCGDTMETQTNEERKVGIKLTVVKT